MPVQRGSYKGFPFPVHGFYNGKRGTKHLQLPIKARFTRGSALLSLIKATSSKRGRLFFLFLFRCIKAVATDQLSSAFRTMLLIAIGMVHSAGGDIAVRTAEPVGRMDAFRIIGDRLKDLSVGVLYGGVSFTGHDGCIRHVLPTLNADSHFLPFRVQGSGFHSEGDDNPNRPTFFNLEP